MYSQGVNEKKIVRCMCLTAVLILHLVFTQGTAVAGGPTISFSQTPDGSVQITLADSSEGWGCRPFMEQPKWSIVGENIDIAAFTAPCGPLPDPIPPFYTTTANVGHLADGLYLVNWRFAGGNVSNPNMPHGCFYIKNGVLENGPAVCPKPTNSGITMTQYPVTLMNFSPDSITAGPDGNIWFTDCHGNDDFGPNMIGKITRDGIITGYTIPAPWLAAPAGIAAGPDGNVWFTEAAANKIGKITPSGVITDYVLPATNSWPHGITAGPDGNLWFTESGKIGKITTAGVITEYPVPAGCIPDVITKGPDGNLWFTDVGTNKIGKITTSGIITEYPIPSAVSTKYDGVTSDPYGITSGPDGNIWFTEAATNKIGKITPNGVITEYVIPTLFSGPWAITAGPDGNIWFTEPGVSRIGKMTTDGVYSEYSLPWDDDMSFGITAGPDGNIWFTERFGGIEKISGMQLAAPAAVPSMNEWGMIIFALLGGLGAAVHLRKRKTGN